MKRLNPPADPAKPGQPRHYCLWIAHPGYHRCPRYTRTGQECWCRTSHEADGKWPWRVVPPLVTDPTAPAWTYDADGPFPVKRGA